MQETGKQYDTKEIVYDGDSIRDKLLSRARERDISNYKKVKGKRMFQEYAGHRDRHPIGNAWDEEEFARAFLKKNGIHNIGYATLKTNNFHPPAKGKKVGRWSIEVLYWTPDMIQHLN